MPLNIAKGNMYSFVTHTFNVIKGRCPHDCEYCYMKVFKLGPLYCDHREFKTDLGKNNFIFVGSSCDMFAEDIPENWIKETLEFLNKFDNRYLFQSKNPIRFWNWHSKFPAKRVFGTTIETNRVYPQMGKTITPQERSATLAHLSTQLGDKIMITIEPIMDFDLDELVKLIKQAKPAWVNVGADSKGHHLPEPPTKEIKRLIDELAGFTEVKIKQNLKRLGIRVS